MQRAEAKAYLSKLRGTLPAALPEESLAFRWLAPNDLGGWNTYSTISVPGGRADLGFGIDSFLSGDPRRLRLWMAAYFTRKWNPVLAKAFKACPGIGNGDIVHGRTVHVAAGAAPQRFSLLRESIFGGTWISRYFDEGELPSAALLGSQVRRFLADVRSAVEPHVREGRASLEGRDLVQGSYWSRRSDRVFRDAHLRKLGHRCQACRYRLVVRGKAIIDLHHMKPFSGGRWRRPTPKTVLVLCPNCHRVAHTATPPMGLAALTRRVASK